MPRTEPSSDMKFEIGRVLFIDIVGLLEAANHRTQRPDSRVKGIGTPKRTVSRGRLTDSCLP